MIERAVQVCIWYICMLYSPIVLCCDGDKYLDSYHPGTRGVSVAKVYARDQSLTSYHTMSLIMCNVSLTIMFNSVHELSWYHSDLVVLYKIVDVWCGWFECVKCVQCC